MIPQWQKCPMNCKTFTQCAIVCSMWHLVLFVKYIKRSLYFNVSFHVLHLSFCLVVRAWFYSPQCIDLVFIFAKVTGLFVCAPLYNARKHVQYPIFALPLNRIPVMVPILVPLLGLLFLRGHISLKNWTYCPVLRVSATPFKSTCLLIRLREVPGGVYHRNGLC
jgi:hypothetical protein